MNLYILQNFNNYTERKVKGYSTYASYSSYIIGSSLNVNFNNNDGIYTEQVVMCDFDTLGFPDYLLVCDDSNNIVSRWFILNVNRERSGKWRLELKHDLVYDNIYNIVNNPNTLIRKGYAPINSPSLFNLEDFNFNEIKSDEKYLKYYDKTSFDCFLIAYLPKTFGTEDYEIELKKDVKLILPRASANYVNTWETSDVPYDIYGIPFKSSWISNISSEMIKYKVVNSDGTNISSCQTSGVDGANILNVFKLFSLLGVYAYDLQIVPFTSINNNNIYNSGEDLICKLDYTALPSAFYDSDIQVPTIASYGVSDNLIYNIPLVNIPKAIFNYSINSTAISDEDIYYSHSFKYLQEKKYRLVSPDYSSIVELNRQLNSSLLYDSVEDKDYIKSGFPTFNISCRLQPIQPYIYIEPVYKGLNGDNYLDTRGLLCNYNFSIVQTSDKWAEFLLNNKNYLNTFNQEVKNLEIKRTQSIIGGVSNVIGSTASGAGAGTLVAPGVGTAVGAIAGLATGVYNMAENIYNTNRAIGNYKRSFKWSCENIQAMPNSLNKISSLVNSNKIFPIIEIYDCLSDEKTNFYNYIVLNGMTIDMVGKIKDYWGGVFFPYVEAVMIRFPSCSATANMLNEINKELDSGLFFEVIE